MSRLDLPGDVFAPDASPVHEVFWRDEDAPVVSGAAAGSAFQTIKGRDLIHATVPYPRALRLARKLASVHDGNGTG